MKKNLLIACLSCMMIIPDIVSAQDGSKMSKTMEVSLRKRIPEGMHSSKYKVVTEKAHWAPSETAIIICDMWNQHWCSGATSRVAELAPRINQVITAARAKGMLIVHAPSDCIDYYKNYPGRKLAKQYRNTSVGKLINDNKLPSEENAVWPIYQEDGGCNETPLCKQRRAWITENDQIKIDDKDAISDSGEEIAGLFKDRGIRNVILTGVHTNMCVIGRPFGLRNMVRLGMNVALMRDMTDAMYDARQWPNVSHFMGVELVIEYIEKYVAPSIASTDITLQKEFRFKGDKRPLTAL